MRRTCYNHSRYMTTTYMLMHTLPYYIMLFYYTILHYTTTLCYTILCVRACNYRFYWCTTTISHYIMHICYTLIYILRA